MAEGSLNPSKDLPNVELIRKEFSQLTDASLATQLQELEYHKKKQWNQGSRQTARTDVPLARMVEDEEVVERQRRKLEHLMRLKKVAEEDADLARQLQQKEMQKIAPRLNYQDDVFLNNQRSIPNHRNNNNNNNSNNNNGNNNLINIDGGDDDDAYERPMVSSIRGVMFGDDNLNNKNNNINNNINNNSQIYSEINNSNNTNSDMRTSINNNNNNVNEDSIGNNNNNNNNNKNNNRNNMNMNMNNNNRNNNHDGDGADDDDVVRLLQEMEVLEERRRMMEGKLQQQLISKEMKAAQRLSGKRDESEMSSRNIALNEGKLGGKMISFKDFEGFQLEEMDEEEKKMLLAMQDEELARALQESEALKAQKRASKKHHHHNCHHHHSQYCPRHQPQPQLQQPQLQQPQLQQPQLQQPQLQQPQQLHSLQLDKLPPQLQRLQSLPHQSQLQPHQPQLPPQPLPPQPHQPQLPQPHQPQPQLPQPHQPQLPQPQLPPQPHQPHQLQPHQPQLPQLSDRQYHSVSHTTSHHLINGCEHYHQNIRNEQICRTTSLGTRPLPAIPQPPISPPPPLEENRNNNNNKSSNVELDETNEYICPKKSKGFKLSFGKKKNKN